MTVDAKPASDPSAPDFRSVLASVDSSGRRRWLHVATMRGRWRNRRTALSVGLIALYLGVPFVSIGGGPLLLIDLPGRHYVVAGRTFWPDDLVFLLLGLLAFAVGTLLLVTLFGRVFCGWLCPHNVFLEMVFRRIERWWEGPAPRRAAAAAKPLTPMLAWRKIGKWACYIVAAAALANAGTALFVGADAFRHGLFIDAAAHPAAAAVWIAMVGLVLFNFGWFREQTCTIVCPYGRLQAAMLDRDTLTIAYDHRRGEPRGKRSATTGDCVDCRLCVQVCPTGIDIRNGVQLECINCTACVDACDSVMDRIGKPRGLIRYASENAIEGKPWRALRPRAALYAAVLAALTITGAVLVHERTAVAVTRLRDTAMPVLEADAGGHQAVRGMLQLALRNRDRGARTVSVRLAGVEGELLTQFPTITLAPRERREQTIYVRIPRDGFAGRFCTAAVEVVDDRGERTAVPFTMEAP